MYETHSAPGGGAALREDVPLRPAPGAWQLLRVRGVDALAPITVRYPMDHARQVLGFQPQCDFEQWLDELRARPEERADTSPPWP